MSIQLNIFFKTDNPKSIFTVCSYREFVFGECPQYVYDQLNQSIFYGDLYFVREVFKFVQLTQEQQYFIKTNDFISFYGRAAYKASEKEGLIQIINIYNSDQTSLQQVLPSVFFNYTASDYENCLGDQFVEPYDPRCRSWYQYVQKNKGFFIFEPYTDAVTGALMMSLSAYMEYESKFYSVNSIDFQMQNIKRIFDCKNCENSYSVLFHEFNSTVFTHPLPLFDQVKSWADQEYFNINQFCSDSQELMDKCKTQKSSFSQQVDESVQFIQTGNYSITDQINKNQLYQFWERFGQKYPMLKQSNNKANLKLKQLEKQNSTNNQSDQSQNGCYNEDESIRYTLNMPQKELQIERSFEEQSKNNQDQFELPQKRLNNYYMYPLQTSKNNFYSNQNQKKLNLSTQRFLDTMQQSHFLEKKNSNNLQQSQHFTLNRTTSNHSPQLQGLFQDKLQVFKKQESIKEQSKDKILQGLKPQFLEMKIIKQVFQDLESVINYQIDSQTQNSQNSMNTLFHFTKAKATFQKLKNQTGLSRCYYNLGIIYLLKYEYSLASEYFESAIQLNLESLGIDDTYLINSKFIDSSSNRIDNQIQILSKRIFSQAYCLKQQALQMIYSKQNLQKQTQKEIEKNNFEQAQINKIDHLTLLKKSMEIFQVVIQLVQNNEFYFSDIFKIFLFQEISEVCLILKEHYQQIKFYFEKINQLFNNQNRSYGQNVQFTISQSSRKLITSEIKSKQNLSNKSGANLSIKKQIFQIQKSKQYFLEGLEEYNKKNYLKAIEQFILSIEEGNYYNPTLRQKAIYHLNQLFQNCLKNQIKENEFEDLNKNEDSTPIDLCILVQLDYCLKQTTTIENCLRNIQQSKLIKKCDRVVIQIYNQELDIFMPLTHIENEQHWDLIINSLLNIQNIFIGYEKKSKIQISWQEALFKSLSNFCQLNKQDQIYSNQISQKKDLITKNNQINDLQNAFKCFKNLKSCKQFERKKIILIFSKDQECDKQLDERLLTISQKFFNYQKPIVYHLKEFSLARYSKSDQQFENLIYESFYEEQQLYSKLAQLRKEFNFHCYQEFLTILNNS